MKKLEWLGLCLIICLFAAGCTTGEQIVATENNADTPALAENGMISSSHPLATQAGIDILKAGGNAFDAAIAVASVLNVVEPMMSGMGGYGTILIYHAGSDQVRFLDSSGKIPSAVDSDAFRYPTPNYQENRRGPMAVSTPGNVNAWEAMSKEYGKLKWEQLFQSAIELAGQGFVVNDSLARTLSYAFDSFPEHVRIFYGDGINALTSGEKLIQKDLAVSLRLVAENGARAFYHGKIGEAIAAEMKRSGGFLSRQDLIDDQAEWWEPISIDYRGYRVFTASPPATAFPSLLRLGMMSRFKSNPQEHNSAAFLHRFAEVTKHAFWCRLAYAGDPEINPPPLDKLLSPAYWDEQIKWIDHDKAQPFSPPDIRIKQGVNTTHFVTADKGGNIVSATQTLGNAFGSRIMAPGTGIWLNNSLAYCTFEPKGNPMDAHAGHRKLSGDCPTIIFRDGKPWVALGTPGGHTIGQTVPQMVMNILDFNMNIQQAIAAPRISFISPDEIVLESGIPGSIRQKLMAKGHNIRNSSGLGNAHGLMLEYDKKGRPMRYLGGADPRGIGLAKGY